ncbi:hypothetical protein QF026_001617 [Streptomyces aurantiacus]|uniref:morphogenic membrane protein MmpA n=1 Tax=Streptomyces aurantiacus TaxID=47760 RepID=UPI00278D2A69|nr:hypothetical protein [Streptomyces aurantiacus]MDQ0773151.1 hypothetical protein [Streptomyces aurantiacus]
MTTERVPQTVVGPVRPAEPAGRAVTAGLVLAVVAGVGWAAGMVYTVMGWRL